MGLVTEKASVKTGWCTTVADQIPIFAVQGPVIDFQCNQDVSNTLNYPNELCDSFTVKKYISVQFCVF